jgi:orotidine-5'-phosphate decarboxylase
MTFKEKWLESVERKDSVVCVGLDPADFEMGRGEKGLPNNINKLDWAEQYIKAVAPFCAAIKPNTQYWKDSFGMKNLEIITTIAKDLRLVTIEDSKLADIGSTNQAGLFYAQQKGFDAVTFSPFAGNLEEATNQAHDLGLGLISMCLMSNPEYETQKNKWVSVDEQRELYFKTEIEWIRSIPHSPQYIFLAQEAANHDTDGIVIGAPSEKNHISHSNLKNVKSHVGENTLILLPGIGAQGGEADIIYNFFGKDQVIVNVGRELMFPKGSQSSPLDQAYAAEVYRDILNDFRSK